RTKAYVRALQGAAAAAGVPWSLGAAWASAVAEVLPSPVARADAAAAAIATAVAALPDDAVTVAQSVTWLVDAVCDGGRGRAPPLHWRRGVAAAAAAVGGDPWV